MVSHSPHNNLSLEIFGGKFCYLRKSIDDDLHIERFFVLFKNVSKILKNAGKRVHFLVKLQA